MTELDDATRKGLDETRRVVCMAMLADLGEAKPTGELFGTVFNAVVYQHQLRTPDEAFALLERCDRPELLALCDEITELLAT